MQIAAAVTPKSLSANVIAGAISSLVSILTAIAATPLYLKFLGAEGFGVLGFALSLQAALLALDGGIAVSATRVVAQSREEQALRTTADLMFGLARVSWCVALAICSLVALLGSVIASRWLNLVELPPEYVAQSLMLAGISIGVRWPLALYQGVLIGSQRLVSLSVLNVFMMLMTTAGAIAMMVWLAPDLRALFGWMAASGLIQVFWCRSLARRVLGAGRMPPSGEVLRFFRLSAAAGWLGVVGLLLMQVDKAVLSRVLPLGLFGYYVMAAMIVGGLYALVTPVFNVLYPRFAVLASNGDATDLRRLYRDSSLALATLLFPVAAALAFFADSIILLWTRNPAAVENGAPIVKLLALATALHGIMFVPYALKLACGASRLALVIGASLLVISLPAIIVAALHWGATGAAGAWLALSLCYIVIGSMLTHRRLLPGLAHRWLLEDVAPPALLSLGAVFTIAWWTHHAAWNAPARAATAAMLVIACWALMACASSRLRLRVRLLFATNVGN